MAITRLGASPNEHRIRLTSDSHPTFARPSRTITRLEDPMKTSRRTVAVVACLVSMASAAAAQNVSVRDYDLSMIVKETEWVPGLANR